MLEFFTINRYALIVRPSEAMIGWVNSVFPGDPIDYDKMKGHDNTDIFLIPEFDSPEDAEEWLQENYQNFLRHSLEAWSTDESTWPKPLSWEQFDRLHEYSIESVVIDTVDEEYDEEFDEEDF